jgi:predicted AAA+ superfamily ATPase
VLVIYGPRRVGKTTLVQEYLDRTNLRYRSDIGDDVRIQNVLGSRDANAILEHVEGLELYVIDEAQMIPTIGTGLKIIADKRADLRVIAIGSSDVKRQ